MLLIFPLPLITTKFTTEKVNFKTIFFFSVEKTLLVTVPT